MAPLAPIIVSEPLSVLPALDSTTSAPLMDFKLMAQLQDACPSMKKMLISPSLKVVSVPVQDFHLLCDVSTGTPQPLVPTYWVKMFFLILMQFHILGSEPHDDLSLVGLFGLGYQQR